MTVGKDSGGKQERETEDFPCRKEKSLSIKCLEENNYDYSECTAVFTNFKFCLEFWGKVKKLRSANHIKPLLPPPEERAEIKKLYMSTGKYPDYSTQKT